MQIKILGAGKTVTGSCYSISINNEKILIDCGMFQGGKDTERLNYQDFNFSPKEYSALLLTHAHLDHCGRIPKLIKCGFQGKIFATDATKELAFIIMMDSAKIAANDVKNENKRRAKAKLPARKPLYTEDDVNTAMDLFEVIDYDKDTNITPNITARFYDAGHILGASSIQVRVTEGRKTTTIGFSGDLGQSESIIVKNTEPIPTSDYVFIESTYGDRLHPKIEGREREFLRIINETCTKGGKLMIPSFAVERAQEILYCIGRFREQGLIPKIDVYLDSPMAIKATRVFSKYPKYYNERIRKTLEKRKDPFSFSGLICTTKTEE